MQKNELIQRGETILRILSDPTDKVLVIDCRKRTMPKWCAFSAFTDFAPCTEQTLALVTGVELYDYQTLDPATKRIIHERYTMIAGALPFIGDMQMRNAAISRLAEDHSVCKQTVRNYLCLYLAYQDICVLAPKPSKEDKPLSKDEKNMRWALNKFFYSKKQNSLMTTYTLMLRAKYCDSTGALRQECPTYNQFYYFYRKHRSMQTYYISRDGLSNYQRNSRPLLGDGVQQFAPNIGVAMLDSTICDIYLVDDAGNLVGRPILTACIDAYSSLCCGYSLSWEGGVYSLKSLMVNVITDKIKLCEQHGIHIDATQWNSNQLPATLVTDKGSEYISANFEQITELGVKMINLPPYRPELKGCVEKFFDLVQGLYKPHLKGKGVIESDFQERGVRDYRKDACLTMDAFETILLHCIIYYNCKRIIENFPYTEAMLSDNVQPHASNIWNWSMTQPGANLISVDHEQLMLTLLPRTEGTFTRHGLKVNQMRYTNDRYTERFLSGGCVTVAYNPDDSSYVWTVENGSYVCFELSESRFSAKNLSAVQAMQTAQKSTVKLAKQTNIQAKIELSDHIIAIANSAVSIENTNIKSVRETRRKAQRKSHIDFTKAGDTDG